MAAYSIDLRQKILPAYERRLGSQRALADVFGVSLSCIEKVLRRYRTIGLVEGQDRHAEGQGSGPCRPGHRDYTCPQHDYRR
jgi:transposase